MDFSDSFKCSGPCEHSPDGRFLASAEEYRLVLRDVESLNVVQLYSCLDKIHALQWCGASRYVLCALNDRGIVQVWSAEEPDWSCKIDEGPAGVASARWAPDARSVVIVADFCVRMTVWSLADRKCTYLPGPKHVDRGIAFSPAGDMMAVLERRECKDWLCVYRIEDWGQHARYLLDTTDAADIAWAPNGATIAVWDSVLYYKVCVYAPDGACEGTYSAYNDALGVRSVRWSPNGTFLGIGSYDQVARILNDVSWQPLLECCHGSPVDAPSSVAVYSEVEEPRGVLAPMQLQQQQQQGQAAGGNKSSKREVRSKYVIAPLPADVTSVPPPSNKPNPKLGISMLEWSPDSRYLATLNENMPAAVWIWDMQAAELVAVLQHTAAVKALAWAPAGSTSLAIAAGSSRVYMWTPAGASIVHSPLASFGAQSVKWAPDGASLVLGAREALCCAYLTDAGGA